MFESRVYIKIYWINLKINEDICTAIFKSILINIPVNDLKPD